MAKTGRTHVANRDRDGWTTTVEMRRSRASACEVINPLLGRSEIDPVSPNLSNPPGWLRLRWVRAGCWTDLAATPSSILCPEEWRALTSTKALTEPERARCACRAKVRPLLAEASRNCVEPRTAR